MAKVAICCIALLGAVSCASTLRTTSNTETLLMPAGELAAGIVLVQPPAAVDRVTSWLSQSKPATGRGVTVYLFDGGVRDDHPELAGRVRRGFDAFPSQAGACNGHATAVAGAAAGREFGVAPEAEIVDVKIIDCHTQSGSPEAILHASRWVARDHREHPDRPAVVNWSFIVDTSRANPEIDSAAALLRGAGLLVVVAAGNFSVDACQVSPANAPGTLVVGASSLVHDAASTAWRVVRTPHTAWGPCVDLYAPGDSVALPAFDKLGAPTTGIWSGSSMSAGYASGAAAIFLELQPTSSPDHLADLVRRSAAASSGADVASHSSTHARFTPARSSAP